MGRVENGTWEVKEEIRGDLEEVLMLALRCGISIGIPQYSGVHRGPSLG